MSETQDARAQGTPKHLWVVGVLAVLWSGMGVLDFVMTQTKNEAYMSGFTPEQLEFFYGFPTWLVVIWAISVFGGVLGGVFLLLKNRLATPLFVISLIAFVIAAFRNYVLSDGMEFMGNLFELAFTGVIFLIAVVLAVYSSAMHKRGVIV